MFRYESFNTISPAKCYLIITAPKVQYLFRLWKIMFILPRYNYSNSQSMSDLINIPPQPLAESSVANIWYILIEFHKPNMTK